MALTHKSDVAQRFSKAAERYDSLSGVQHKLANIAIAQAGHLSGCVLDIGCATGMHTRRLSEYTVGVDIAFGMLRKAASRACSAHSMWVNGDMDALPFLDNQFSHVFSSMSLQWTQSPELVLTQIYRVLAHNGKATLLIPVQGAFKQLIAAFETANFKSTINTMLPQQTWCEAASDAGFKVSSKCILQIDTHESVSGVLASISKIGASASTGGIRAPLNRNKLKVLAQSYPRTPAGFELDYRCVLMTLEK